VRERERGPRIEGFEGGSSSSLLGSDMVLQQGLKGTITDEERKSKR
jgi:hypothetical protein